MTLKSDDNFLSCIDSALGSVGQVKAVNLGFDRLGSFEVGLAILKEHVLVVKWFIMVNLVGNSGNGEAVCVVGIGVFHGLVILNR